MHWSQDITSTWFWEAKPKTSLARPSPEALCIYRYMSWVMCHLSHLALFSPLHRYTMRLTWCSARHLLSTSIQSGREAPHELAQLSKTWAWNGPWSHRYGRHWCIMDRQLSKIRKALCRCLSFRREMPDVQERNNLQTKVYLKHAEMTCVIQLYEVIFRCQHWQHSCDIGKS